MALVVQKFGGTSVGTVEKIRNVAKRVICEREKGNDVIVVVSAMSGETNKLVSMAREIAERPVEREYDVLVSTGEQVTIALLAMALHDMECKAVSYTASQVKIVTDSAHSRARIKRIDSEKIHKNLHDGKVVVVAGFQGVDEEGNLTTLGRGGSDTSAVAIAAALNADVCDIYTDVEGVYTTDPNICDNARKLKKISYDEMLEMASLGAKVLQTRSVEFAKKYNVPVHVRSTFSKNSGTMVTKEDKDMEKVAVSGVAYNKDEAKITIIRVPDKPGIAASLFGPIADANINVDMIIQNISEDGYTDMTFTVPKGDYEKAFELVEKTGRELGAKGVAGDTNISKVSVIGVGMRSHAGIASSVFGALSREGINIQMISTSEIKVSCVIDSKYTELAVRVLHDAFNLGEGEVVEEKA
ncbi:MAG: aspartate kinase [Deltaproteobacteria bacterium]|nr:aspartate kinase [Deltaproteobacteria bacterium]